MNCVIIDDDHIQYTIFKEYINELVGVNCLATFSNPIDFLNMENKSEIDFIILDMEMPKMSGLDLLNSLSEPISVLVISSKKEYAIDVINHNVLGYLLKPVKFIDFMKTIEKIKLILKRTETNIANDKNYLFIKSDGMLYKLNYNDVLYITAAVDYIEVFTKEKKYLVHSSMNKTEEKLPSNQFFRIHRSTIININHIKIIDRDFIEINEQTLKIAPSKKENFLNFINSL
jgi:DNA-binding LytR/AlgR family response regulator|tara:strand:+ start:229 stop:918 length:690 start_codon:yes stop_codon:yes gene_type:complete